MGESAETDILKEGFDATEKDEPETEEVVEIEETETPAPDVSETQETEEAVQETETETETEEENRLDPLFGRLGDISVNDREMVQRHYDKAQERDAIQGKFEEAERRIAELEGMDTFSVQAGRILEAIKDPRTRQKHEEFRATHTDQEYVLAIERQKVEDQFRDPPPEEDPRDKRVREMETRLVEIERRGEQRDRERGKRLLQEDSTRALGELKVPEKYHAYLLRTVANARASSTIAVDTYDKLRRVVKDVWDELEPILKSEQTATKEALKKKTTPAKKRDETEDQRIVTKEHDGDSIDTVLGAGMDAAQDGMADPGAS